jgi:NAD(P)-dependent dehydrogenase (short-subunit alcohol dehydrogenase family)
MSEQQDPGKNPFTTSGNGHGDLGGLKGGLAFITGSASGIGFALAEAAVAHGMHPVIADIRQKAIDIAVENLATRADQMGVDVIGEQIDVSEKDSVNALATSLKARFPDRPMSLLACNAGVGGGGSVLNGSEEEWEIAYSVNLKGVLNCIRAFVPGMLTQGAPGSVMATASQDGLCASSSLYGVTKHACVALMETLHGELQGKLTSHVLCPNVVATNIVGSAAYRPERFGGPQQIGEGVQRIADRFKSQGLPPSQCASEVFEAMRSGTFYVMAEAEKDPGYIRLEVTTRMDSILNGDRPFRPRSEWIAQIFTGSD